MKIFKHQLWHILSLTILLYLFYLVLNENKLDILAGSLWGVKTDIWLIIALLSPIIHQIYVLICWRLELYDQVISKSFGKEKGFKLYKVGFTILILSRIVTLVLLSVSNEGTLHLNPYFLYACSCVLLIPVIFLFYSVKKYFGINRAFGIDHFEPEKSKSLPMVRKGIFKYTSNGMYAYGFLILWIPGFMYFSKAALLVALFQHIYIWIHYYFTELPDMNFIYGKKSKL